MRCVRAAQHRELRGRRNGDETGLRLMLGSDEVTRNALSGDPGDRGTHAKALRRENPRAGQEGKNTGHEAARGQDEGQKGTSGKPAPRPGQRGRQLACSGGRRGGAGRPPACRGCRLPAQLRSGARTQPPRPPEVRPADYHPSMRGRSNEHAHCTFSKRDSYKPEPVRVTGSVHCPRGVHCTAEAPSRRGACSSLPHGDPPSSEPRHRRQLCQ